MFVSKQKLQKSTSTSLNANDNLVNMSEVISRSLLVPDPTFQRTHKTKNEESNGKFH